jgi:Domain of unknown function (DUF4145)
MNVGIAMPPKEVVPQLGLDSFSCPHCGALAHQHWFQVFVSSYEKGKKPFVYERAGFEAADTSGFDESDEKRLKAFKKRFWKNEVTYEVHQYGHHCNWELVNVEMSMCHSCDAFAIWVKGKLAWPSHSVKIEPHPDMPDDIKDDFIEAAFIVDASPRGSAALSRLIVQKLMSHLGGQGKDINANIAFLVKNGLEPEIQMALDIVRVTGNNAVHPGELALKEDTGAAVALLQLVNLVVERRIATQKRIEEMFANLPPGAREQIEKRDGVTLHVLKSDNTPKT